MKMLSVSGKRGSHPRVNDACVCVSTRGTDRREDLTDI